MFSLINLLYMPVIFVPTTIKIVLQNVKRINAGEKRMWGKRELLGPSDGNVSFCHRASGMFSG